MDYGKVKWFKESINCGVVDTVYNGSVFIHTSNIIGVVKACSFVLIGEVKKNYIKKRLDGLKVTVLDIDGLCEEVLKIWLCKLPLKYNFDLKWLFEHCSDIMLNEIINVNRSIWCQDELFLSALNSCVTSGRNLRKNEVATKFFFEIWELSKEKTYDKNLERVLHNDSTNRFLEKALQIDYEWIRDGKFVITIGYGFSSIYRKFTIINDFLLNKIIHEKVDNYNDDLKWIVNHGSGEVLKNILEFKFLYSNKEFVAHFNGTDNRYGVPILSHFKYNLWLFSERYIFNDDIRWIMYHGSVNFLVKVFEINYNVWCNDSDFIKACLELNSTYGRYCTESFEPITKFKNTVDLDKIEVIENFIYKISELSLENNDGYVYWLIKNAQISTLKKIFDNNKKKWLSNKFFIDKILELRFANDDGFKENVLFEFCMHSNTLKYDETIKWIFENANIKNIKIILIKKFGYFSEFIEKVYLAFYPLNNREYFTQKANRNSWSLEFKLDYISNQTFRINCKFSKLFLSEIKQKEQFLKRKIFKKKVTHTATDFSNFLFCPASYAINETYVINIQEQQNVFIGTREHEKQRLLSFADCKTIGSNRRYFTEYSTEFLRIINSTCISSGHNTSSTKIYYSKQRKLAGTPDYIFQDSLGFFAVEEKYTLKSFDEVTELYINHKIQALVYLYGLDEFNFKDVYVIYWFIQKDSQGDFYVHNYRIFHLSRSNENRKLLLNTFNSLESIQNGIAYNFDLRNINYKKCINCNYFSFCEFKNGSITTIKL